MRIIECDRCHERIKDEGFIFHVEFWPTRANVDGDRTEKELCERCFDDMLHKVKQSPIKEPPYSPVKS